MAGRSIYWALLLNTFLVQWFFFGIFVQGSDPKSDGEFVAGTFILTQKSLDEAPYRYAGVLRQVLDKIETKNPPSREELSECSTKYKIAPSGRRSKLNIIKNTLGFQLHDNNTLIIAVRISAEVTAKTWIWKGINFGLLGCLKMTACGGDIVTYRAEMDMELAIQITMVGGKMSIFIKPVHSELHQVNVIGCRPPWYLFWFKGYQKLLESGIQEGFQEKANDYEKMKTVPEEFSPFPDAYVKYVITDLLWSKDYVKFGAKATFLATLNGKNVTFIPQNDTAELISSSDNQTMTTTRKEIPLEKWNMESVDDAKSHLLQGVRITTEFINSLMWFASLTNITRYHGSTKFLDTTINGTISYDPPKITVHEDNLLNINIHRGLIMAKCLPNNSHFVQPETLFKAEFNNLAGSGKISLASTADKTGIRVSLDQLDLSSMNTKPFEPKLPLPEAFESQLMKSSIAQLQPVVNQYLTEKPFYLPENVSPLAAAPVINLWSTGNGYGYAELLSYCTCDEETNTPFAICDKRSEICSKQGGGGHNKPVSRLKESKKTVIKSKSIVEGQFQESSPTSEINFKTYSVEHRRGNISYEGMHLTLFEDSNQCSIDQYGFRAQVFWLWKTHTCTPLYWEGQIHYYYVWNQTSLSMHCEDEYCQICQFQIDQFSRRRQQHHHQTEKQLDPHCHQVNQRQNVSFSIGRPLIYSWQTSQSQMSIMANVFFSEMYCSFHPSYIQPQMLSSHINLGTGLPTKYVIGSTCQISRNGNAMDLLMNSKQTFVEKANWQCYSANKCYGCFYRLNNTGIDNCVDYRKNLKIVFTKTIHEFKPKSTKGSLFSLSENNMIYMGVGLAFVLVTVILFVAFFIHKQKEKIKEKIVNSWNQRGRDFKSQMESCKEKMKKLFKKNLGNRFKVWKTQDTKLIKDDVIQNVMLLSNGILGIVFAIEWNSENNPLSLIHNKFKPDDDVGADDSSTTMGKTLNISDLFETKQMAKFADNLNFYTFWVNIVNSIIAFLIIIIWCITVKGQRSSWMKVRLASCVSFLASTFMVLALLIFGTYFDELVVLKQNAGYFLTDNESMYEMGSYVLNISLNGLSLTVISFTIVFLFHGVGGGLFCGTVVFRLSHLASKTSHMEVLTTLLVILTIIQPFICLHPVIIWSKDSQQNSMFLILIILIWFLPLGIHAVTRTILNQESFQKCARKAKNNIQTSSEGDAMFERKNISPKINSGVKKSKSKVDSGLRKNEAPPLPPKPKVPLLAPKPKVDSGLNSKAPSPPLTKKSCSERKKTISIYVDISIQLIQLSIFLITFSIITHHIVNTEFNYQRSNLQNFVLPAIVSVFVWMMSISYLLLSLVLDESRKTPRLVFKDQNLQGVRERLRSTIRRTLKDSDQRSSIRARSLHRQAILEAAAKRQGRGRTMPAGGLDSLKIRPYQDLNASARSKISNFNEPIAEVEEPSTAGIELLECKNSIDDVNDEVDRGSEMEDDDKDQSCWGTSKRLYHFLMESTEYLHPDIYGWRIKFRRMFLTVGTLAFTYTTTNTAIATTHYSSKDEIQNILDYAGTNLTWPDSGSALDDVFELYNSMTKTKSYLMMTASLLFWIGLIMDFISHHSANYKTMLFSTSRISNFFGSLIVFASVIIVGLPDYLEASNLDRFCPPCGVRFDKTVRQVAEFSIGLFFACLFTFQLFPILITIGPALVRASVLILIHPALQIQESDELTNLRMTILTQVIQFSSMLTFPVTFMSMAIFQQYQKDFYVTVLIMAFWSIPPISLGLGVHFSRKYSRYSILLWIYYLYNFAYVGLLLSLVIYSLSLERILEILKKFLQDPSFWTSSIAQVSMCNVVISDMLYMTVFE